MTSWERRHLAPLDANLDGFDARNAVSDQTRALNSPLSVKLPPPVAATLRERSTSAVPFETSTRRTIVPAGKRTASISAGGPATACVAT